jgi:pyruvate/2-oxoglutarate dehydrogenase complex dihydrolipoamide acyltransferase (E2) component
MYDYGEVPAARWNVLDVMNVVAPPSIPVPLFYDIDVSWAEALRKRYASLGHKVTITSIMLKAIALAQREHPLSRTQQLTTGKLITLNQITAGFTVERNVNGTPAVFFGTIENADNKSILEIAAELRAYSKDPIESIPQLKLQMQCLNYPNWVRKLVLHLGLLFPALRMKIIPASFGLTSVGRWGCKTGIPPCITTTSFGVGKVFDRAIVVNRKIVIKPLLSVTYVFDHRILDGGPACRFMRDLTGLLEGGMEQYVKDELNQLASSLRFASRAA